MNPSMTYADAGVDIDKADSLVDVFKKIAKRTHRKGVLGDIGGFGGLFSLDTSQMDKPILVSSTDGVGTKLKIAFLMNRHDTVGIDLVAMCVNDIAVQGATPLFFLDYLATGGLHAKTATDIVTGIGEGCVRAGCALIGGETAEMPGFYGDNEYDLAGFAVGVLDEKDLVNGATVQPGDQLVGVGSSGLHSNGYSLVRRICFDVLGLTVDSHVPDLGTSIGEELLVPTRIYARTVQFLLQTIPVKGLAHITGGGLADNIVRVLPKAHGIRIKKGSWDVPPIFPFLQKAGKVAEKEMMRTFNNGIGLVAIVSEKKTQAVLDRLVEGGETAWTIGEVVQLEPRSQARVQWV